MVTPTTLVYKRSLWLFLKAPGFDGHGIGWHVFQLAQLAASIASSVCVPRRLMSCRRKIRQRFFYFSRYDASSQTWLSGH